LASTIPIAKLIFKVCDFFLDTVFAEFYTFVNCNVSLAGSMSTRQRENRNHGNQESSREEAGKEGSQKSSKEEVSKQHKQATHSGDAKASPEVFLRAFVRSGDGRPILCDHFPLAVCGKRTFGRQRLLKW
jgi:hypothetical protein